MRFSSLSIALTFTLALACSGTAISSPTPRMTGQQLVEHFQGEPGVSMFSQKPEWVLKMKLADGYISGVADAYQGTAWCDKGTVKQDEISATVIFDLKKLDKQTLQQPAAKLVLSSLTNKFPCGKK